MASIDPVQNSDKSLPHHETTKHPGVCLLGLFSVLVGSALGVHLLFSLIF